ncbi:hypothetical protein MPL3365_230145 [Mesorhizobium plurifarium]|uniref:Uncharacterized protein n=1 Tax=Mesorhizobium plurifarium TaxID=69974 RepID=A0A090GB03_MESPL|nr:hypothetical protein MPL3365_230145 [Mesorhizobium plurifarium]
MHAEERHKACHHVSDRDKAEGVNPDRQAYDDRTEAKIEDHRRKLRTPTAAVLAQNQACHQSGEFSAPAGSQLLTDGGAETEEHRELQTCCYPFGPLDEHRRDLGDEELGRRLAEESQPDIEIGFGDVRKPQVNWHRPSMIVAALQNDGAPEIRHLLQMRLPIASDFPGEDGSEPLVLSHPGIEFADQRSNRGSVDAGACQGLFGGRANPVEEDRL